MKRIAILLVLLLFVSSFAYGQAGYLDETFGDGGVVVIQSSKNWVYALNVYTLPDDKILLTGRGPGSQTIGDQFIARYTSNGDLDSSFGSGGYYYFSQNTGIGKGELFLYPDGRFLAYGGLTNNQFPTSRPFIVRFLANGKIDSSFGVDGYYIAAEFPSKGGFSRFIVQKDSSIVALGLLQKKQSQTSMYIPTITHITHNGKSNEMIGDKGTIIIGDGQDTGRIVRPIFYRDDRCVFYFLVDNVLDPETKMLCAYLDGKMDSTFGENGKVEMQLSDGGEEMYDLAQGYEQKLLCSVKLTGSDTGRTILIGFLPTGEIDLSFGEHGVAQERDDPFLYSPHLIAFDSSQNILHAGYKYDSLNVLSTAILCYNSDGTIDSSWGKNGQNIDLLKYKIDIKSIATQRDGRLLVYGNGPNDTGRTSILFRINGSDRSRVQNITLPLSPPISLHPTPSTDNCTVTYTLSSSSQCTITLRDESGREVRVFAHDEYRTIGEHKEELDLRGLSSGVYFLQIESNGTIQTAKLIKQ